VLALFTALGIVYGIFTGAVTIGACLWGHYLTILPGILIGYFIARETTSPFTPIFGTAIGYFVANFWVFSTKAVFEFTLFMAVGACAAAGIYLAVSRMTRQHPHLMCV
jgi:hypothetical protein